MPWRAEEDRTALSFLERLGMKFLLGAAVLLVAALLVPALAGSAVGGAMTAVGALLLKWSWTA
jgi:membrane protein implicated in regulation of membrane protease activity